MALAAASTACLLAVAEAGLRLAGFGDIELYDPDPEAFWVLRPNQECRTKIGRKAVHVNQHGFRGEPFPEEKPPGEMRVFIFGDSVTYGWGVGDEETYARRLEQQLRGDELPVRVVNAGVNAYALFQEEIAFRRSLRFSPDAVVFAFSFNESWQNLEGLSPSGRERVLEAVEWKNALRRFALFHAVGEIQLRFVYDRLRQRLSTDIHGGRAPDIEDRLHRYRETMKRIEADARDARLPLAFVILPIRNKADLDPYQAAMASFCHEEGIMLLDLTTASSDPADQWFVPGDTVHPSPSGHADIARRLAPRVKLLLVNGNSVSGPVKAGRLLGNSMCGFRACPA